MNEKDVLIELFEYFSGISHHILDDLDMDTISWQPDPEANSIFHTFWHISRSMDILKTRLVEGRSMDDEVWFSRGWTIKTGYNPKGVGLNASGNLAGYTLAEVKRVPILPSAELLIYFDDVMHEMNTYLAQVGVEELHALAPGNKEPSLSRYDWIWSFLIDGIQHLGEIKAIIAMYQRHKDTK